ncbi:MAG: coiled-coil domain-containing protein mad1 [Icmadophila ericetorum]|nr:coiled-coil domain-containing protein mad1 [Icmadophila ericetorum]
MAANRSNRHVLANTQPSYDFLGGQENSPPQGFRQTFRESHNVKPDMGNEELRTLIKTLRYELETVKHEREVVSLRHEKELRDVQAKAEADFKRAHASETGKSLLSSKYETLANQFQELQKQLEGKQKDLQRKLRASKEESRSLQEDLEGAQSELSSTTRQYKYQLQEIEARHATLKETLDGLRHDLDQKSIALQEAQNRLSLEQMKVGQLESEVLQLKAHVGDAENLERVKQEFSEQVSCIRKLEKTNREQLTELRHLRQIHKATEIVEEEKRVLENKVRQMDDLRRELGEAQFQQQLLEAERASWTSYLESARTQGHELEFDSPEALAHVLVQERLEKASLVERLGSVQPQILEKEEIIRFMESEKATLQAELSKAKRNGGSGDSHATARLERQRALVIKEMEYLREQLKTFEADDITNEVKDPEADNKNKRVHDLELLLHQHRIEIETLHNDLSGQADKTMLDVKSISLKRTHDDADTDERLGVITRKNRKLQADLVTIQQSYNLLQHELIAAKSQLSSLQESTRTRIISLRSNSTSDFEALKLNTITTLRAENKALLAQLSGEPHAAKVVPTSTAESMKLEIQELEKTVADREKRMDRLKKIWTLKSLEFREAVASLLGWKMDFMPNGRFKMTSIYNAGGAALTGAPTDGDGAGDGEKKEEKYIIFDGEAGSMKISGGPKSAFAQELSGLIRFWVEERHEIPAFLAAVTLEGVDKKDMPR